MARVSPASRAATTSQSRTFRPTICSAPSDNFFVSRYSLDVLARSRVGGIVINRETTDGSDPNRTVGADANRARAEPAGHVLRGQDGTPGLDGQDAAWFGQSPTRTRTGTCGSYLDVQDNFNPEVASSSRRASDDQGVLRTDTAPGRFKIRMMEPMVVLTYITDQENRMIGRTQHPWWARFDDSCLSFIYQRNLDVTDEPFRLQSSRASSSSPSTSGT
jgi:hypothetical protein